MNQTSQHKFIFIIGAGRSGTTMMASLLGQLPDSVVSLENRYVWMYDAYWKNNDVRLAAEVTSPIETYIKNYFDAISKQKKIKWLIEKTPSNCFRIEFIEAIFPGSLYIHLIRDGRAVAYSSCNAYSGVQASDIDADKTQSTRIPKDIYYLQRMYEYSAHLKKGGFPIQAWIPTLLKKVIDMKDYFFGRTPIWGARYPGIELDAEKYDDYEIAAIQWDQSIRYACKSLERHIDQNRRIDIQYETLVHHPVETITNIVKWLGIELDESLLKKIGRDVKATGTNKWESGFSEFQILRISELIEDSLKLYKYV